MSRTVIPPWIAGEEKLYSIGIITNDPDSGTTSALNLSSYQLPAKAELWWHGEKQIDFTVANGGIEIVDLAPDLADPPEDTVHFRIRVSEAQTASVPLGAVAYFLLPRIDSLGVTTIRGPVFVDRTL